MTHTAADSAQTLGSYRKSDAVIIVCQNNDRKIMEVAALNEEAARASGYANEELVGKPFETILPARIASVIAEFVEYGNDNDLLSVLGKISAFAIRGKDGKELPFRQRIIRGEEIDGNPWFHLVLVDEEKRSRTSAFRHTLKEHFKGHEALDERTGLTHRSSMLKNMELTTHSVRGGQVSATFAVMDINHYERLQLAYGQATCDRLHAHVGQTCKMRLRAEDAIGTLSERTLGVILIDAPQDPAQMVLNRLRWVIGTTPLAIRHQGKSEELLAQVNIGFAPMDGKISETQVLEQCEAFINAMRQKQTQNSIQLVVAG